MSGACAVRVALVTGASRGGIGSAIAVRLAAEGAKVAITARSQRGLEETAAHDDVFLAPRVLDGVDTTWLCFPVQLRPETGYRRKALQVHLLDAGIQNRLIFSGNVTRQPMVRGVNFRADPKGYPNADQIMRYGTMLPYHPTMTKDDCEYLYETLDAFIAKNRS